MTEFQKNVLNHIREQMSYIRAHSEESVHAELYLAAGYAFALYRDLDADGRPPTFSAVMLQNRRVQPTDPEFFNHLHALDEFLSGVTRNNQEFSDDPV